MVKGNKWTWTLKRRLHYHRLKRFVGWRKGKNAGKSWADFLQWEKEHPDGVTLESIIKKDEERKKQWEEFWARERELNIEKQRIADLRRELIKSIRRKKDWTEEEKRKAIGVINMTSNAKFKEMNILEG